MRWAGRPSVRSAGSWPRSARHARKRQQPTRPQVRSTRSASLSTVVGWGDALAPAFGRSAQPAGPGGRLAHVGRRRRRLVRGAPRRAPVPGGGVTAPRVASLIELLAEHGRCGATVACICTRNSPGVCGASQSRFASYAVGDGRPWSGASVFGRVCAITCDGADGTDANRDGDRP